MDILLGLAVAAALIWLFLKDNTRRGVRTVKAYVYLQAIENGKSREQANEEAEAIGKVASKRLIQLTMLHLQDNYQGKAKLMNKEAEKAGWLG